MTHELKTWPEPFQAILDGRKAFEIRKADRPFAVGDALHLREWSPFYPVEAGKGDYTGREATVRVTYLVSGGAWGLPPDLCVMGIAAPSPLPACTLEYHKAHVAAGSKVCPECLGRLGEDGEAVRAQAPDHTVCSGTCQIHGKCDGDLCTWDAPASPGSGAGEIGVYHPDPVIDSGVRREAAENEAFDRAAGAPPGWHKGAGEIGGLLAKLDEAQEHLRTLVLTDSPNAWIEAGRDVNAARRAVEEYVAGLREERDLARARCDGSCDIALARRQVGPDGIVPGNAKECAELWEREAARSHTEAREWRSRAEDNGALATAALARAAAAEREMDEARAERDRLAEALRDLAAKVAECVPCLEVRNWPPGWRLKDELIKSARAALLSPSPPPGTEEKERRVTE